MEKMLKEKYTHFENGEKMLLDAAKKINMVRGSLVVRESWWRWNRALKSHNRMVEFFGELVKGVERSKEYTETVEMNCQKLISSRELITLGIAVSRWKSLVEKASALRGRAFTIMSKWNDKAVQRCFSHIVHTMEANKLLRIASAHHSDVRKRLVIRRLLELVETQRRRTLRATRRKAFVSGVQSVLARQHLGVVLEAWGRWTFGRRMAREAMKRTRRRQNRLFTLLVEKTRQTQASGFDTWRNNAKAVVCEEEREVSTSKRSEE